MLKDILAYHAKITGYRPLSGDPEEQAGWRSQYIGKSGLILVVRYTAGDVMRFLEMSCHGEQLFIGRRLTTSPGAFSVNEDGKTASIITHNSQYDLCLYKRLDGADPDDLTAEQKVYQEFVQRALWGLWEREVSESITTHDALRIVAKRLLPGREAEFLDYLLHSTMDDRVMLRTGGFMDKHYIVPERLIGTPSELLVALREPLAPYQDGAPLTEWEEDQEENPKFTKLQLLIYLYDMDNDESREKAVQEAKEKGYPHHIRVGKLD